MRKKPNGLRQLLPLGIGMMVILCLVAWTVTLVPAQQKSPSSKPQASVETEETRIVPAAKDIRESSGIWVFLGWIWVSILVLIYFLRLKIREADRLYRLKYFSSPKK